MALKIWGGHAAASDAIDAGAAGVGGGDDGRTEARSAGEEVRLGAVSALWQMTWTKM